MFELKVTLHFADGKVKDDNKINETVLLRWFKHIADVLLCILKRHSSLWFLFQLDHPDYHVDKSIAAASAPISGTEVAIEVTYEPSSIGESHATLTINSPLGGDYNFPIFGVCTTPKPQVILCSLTT